MLQTETSDEYNSPFYLFLYFSYHYPCRKDQFTVVIILKFGIEGFTDPGLLKSLDCRCGFAFTSVS